MSDPAKVAMKNLERVLSRDPMLRDVLQQTVPRSRTTGAFTPDVDVLARDGEYIVLVDLPGIKSEHLTVELEGLRLVIEGERRRDRPKGAEKRSIERRFGPFRREFVLPATANGEQVRAVLKDGVLRVTIPTVGKTGRRSVEIEE